MKKNNKNPNESDSLKKVVEEKLKKINVAGISIGSDADTLKLIHELEVQQLELKMQNEELNLAKEKEENALKKYTKLYDYAPTGYFSLYRDGIISELNLSAARMLGKERLKLVNSNFRQYIFENTLPVFNDFIQKLFENNTREQCEVRLATKEIPSSYIHLEGIVSKNDQKCFLSAIDITSRKKDELNLQIRYDLERIISKISTEFINLNVEDIDSGIQNVLKKIAEFSSSVRSSVFLLSDNMNTITNTHEWCSNPDDSQIDSLQGIPFETFGYYMKLLLNHENVIISELDDLPLDEAHAEREWSKKYGFRPLLFIPMVYEEKLYGTVGFYGYLGEKRKWNAEFTDLLKFVANIIVNAIQRKKTEENLHSSKHLIEGILNTIPVRVFWKDKNLDFLGCNISFAKDAGFNNPNEIVGKDDYQMAWAEMAELYRNDDRQVIDSGQSKLLIEESQKRSDGKIATLLTSKIPMRNSLGEVTGLLGTYMDISDRKIAEISLRESDKRFNLAMEASQDGLFDWNLQTNEIYYSPGWKRMLGYDYNELTNDFSIWEKLTDPEDIKRSWEMLQELKNKNRDRFVMEFKMKHKDGHWVDIISKAKAIFDKNDEPVRIIGTHTDITRQKEFESMIVKERNQAQQYLDIAGVMLGVLDNNGDIIQMNNKGCKILGYNKEEIINKNWFKLCIDPKRSAEVIEGFHNIINGNLELFEYYENDIITKTGEIKTLAFHNSIIRDEKNNINSILFSGDDITLRKLAEESLSESEEKFRNLADNSPNMIFINKNGKIVYANKKVEEITGYKIDTLYSDSFDFLVLIEPEYRDMIMDNFYKHLNGEEAQIIEYRIRTLSGKSIDALLNTKLIKYERDTAILGIITDISKRKKNENKLNASYLELRKLTEKLLHVREDERASVAREIHDDLGQSLTAIKMDVSLLHKHKIIDAETREQKFKILLELINTTIQSVKRIASDLRPGILDDLGLIPAIEWLTEEFEQRYKLKCNLSIISKDVDLEEDVSVAVFRIYQESLTNIARHSKATKIDIHIGFREDRKLYLDIQDNGIGIDYEGLKNNNSYGIIGMKERIGLLNGEIDIIGKPNKGTLIKVVVPY